MMNLLVLREMSASLDNTGATTNQEVPREIKGDFQSLFSETLHSTLSTQAKKPSPNSEELLLEKGNHLLIEELEEILFLEISLLNSLDQNEMREEYFIILEELVTLSTKFYDSSIEKGMENTTQRLVNLSEKVLTFIHNYLKENMENKEPLPQKQQANMKELMALIEKKLEKVFHPEAKQFVRAETSSAPTFSATTNSFSQVSDLMPNAPITMSHLHQPKQATIQWVIDTTSNQAAREQLVQKLEAILSKSQSRMVNGNQSITIRLNPEHLGTLHIKLQETQQGLAARLIVHSKIAASLLDSSIATLKHNLVNANINIEKVEVVFQDQEQRAFQQNKQSSEEQSHKDHSSKNGKGVKENDQSFEELFLEEIQSKELVGEQ